MKKTLIVLIALFSIVFAKIMVMNTDLEDIDKHYIQLNISNSLFNKYLAYVDFGQGGNFGKHVVKTSDGKKRSFTSEIDVLNAFYENGWEINSVVSEPYSTTKDSTMTVQTKTYYILERMGDK